MRREVLYTLEGIYREDFKITGFTFGQGDRAACVVGSMRGNEYQQTYICSQLIKELKKLEEHGQIANGKEILIIPCINQYATNIDKRFWPLDDSDINRKFPGFINGDTTQQIAANLMEVKMLEGQPVLHIRGTKTDNANRFVPIPDILCQRIKNTPKFDYISPNNVGKKHDASSYRRITKSLYREMNISMGCRVYRNKLIPPFPLAEDFVPYDLRHTYCTDLQKKGIDIRTAQYLMGHSDISLTANIYTHADNSTILEAAKLINGTICLYIYNSRTPVPLQAFPSR